MPDDLSHNDNDSTWVPEDDDCSVIIDHDEQSNHHDHYLFIHDNTNKHIDNRHHHKSPKWHPTNPHTGNFAD